jgi:hypothetical protein
MNSSRCRIWVYVYGPGHIFGLGSIVLLTDPVLSYLGLGHNIKQHQVKPGRPPMRAFPKGNTTQEPEIRPVSRYFTA